MLIVIIIIVVFIYGVNTFFKGAGKAVQTFTDVTNEKTAKIYSGIEQLKEERATAENNLKELLVPAETVPNFLENKEFWALDEYLTMITTAFGHLCDAYQGATSLPTFAQLHKRTEAVILHGTALIVQEQGRILTENGITPESAGLVDKK